LFSRRLPAEGLRLRDGDIEEVADAEWTACSCGAREERRCECECGPYVGRETQLKIKEGLTASTRPAGNILIL